MLQNSFLFYKGHSSHATFLESGTIPNECSVKTVDTDLEVEMNTLPDFVKDMTEEDRKRWKKKSRKKRLQLRRKLQREASKTSPECGTELHQNEIEAELEISSPKADSSLMEEMEEVN